MHGPPLLQGSEPGHRLGTASRTARAGDDVAVRYHALACDYDGTLATDGVLADSTAEALERVRELGRKLVLVTGRKLDDLERACPRLDLFDRVVAENGALLHRPESGEERMLAPPPPRGVRRLAAAR